MGTSCSSFYLIQSTVLYIILIKEEGSMIFKKCALLPFIFCVPKNRGYDLCTGQNWMYRSTICCMCIVNWIVLPFTINDFCYAVDFLWRRSVVFSLDLQFEIKCTLIVILKIISRVYQVYSSFDLMHSWVRTCTWSNVLSVNIGSETFVCLLQSNTSDTVFGKI